MITTHEVEVVQSLDMLDTLDQLRPGQVFVLDGSMGALTTQQEEALASFVERGGGLVCVGNAAETYHEYELLGQVLGDIGGTCSTRSEMIVRVANPDH